MLIIKPLSGKYTAYNSPISIAGTESKKDAFTLFQFAAENSTSEWQIDGYKEGGTSKFVIATSHADGHEVNTDKRFGYSLKTQVFSMHSHPKTNEYGSNGDQGVFTRKYNKLNNGILNKIMSAKHYVYNIK